MPVSEVLRSLGLSGKEEQVYLAMLRTGSAGASLIAKEAGIARQTTYSILDDLVRTGFIEQSDRKGVRQYFADPNQLIRLIDSRKGALEQQKRVIEEELPKLLAENKRGKEFPLVQYYEGRQGLERLLRNILDQYRKGKLKTFRGYGINRFYPGMEDFLKFFLQERAKYAVKANLFIANAPSDFTHNEDNDPLGRSFKRLDIEEQDAAIYLVGSAVYLFSYKDNVGVMVENKAITNYLKEAFDAQWEQAA